MKRFGWILAVLMLASPAWAAKKVTVQQLKDMLVSMQQSHKTDDEVASELKQVELTEEMTVSTKNSLAGLLPVVNGTAGLRSSEQIYVLEARSATLAPPAADLPATAALDAAAQKALLDKAADYAKTYAQLPHLTGSKSTIRFQDNVEAAADYSGMHSGSLDSDPSLVMSNHFIHYINQTDGSIELQNGVEVLSKAKDNTRWGANKMLGILGQSPDLGSVISDAEGTGMIGWLRWELVNGKSTAVFSFSVDKKKSHLNVNYCCFPTSDQTGVMHYSPNSPMGAGAVHGNMQTNTSYDQVFKATVPYHGEIFIDPDTGIVIRLITQAEFKTSDMVQKEDRRIDYGPMVAGAKALVPVKAIVQTIDVPNGDAGSSKFTTRTTLLNSDYKSYQAAQ